MSSRKQHVTSLGRGFARIWVRLTLGISLILLVAGIGLVSWVNHKQRTLATQQARDFAAAMHQTTVAGLTGMMITGTIGQRSIFLDQIRQFEGIRNLRVVRGEAVVKQFGPGTNEETAAGKSELEVLRTKQPRFDVAIQEGQETLLAVLPIVAGKEYLGKDCLSCHAVAEGESLGVVSMAIALDKANKELDGFRRELLLAALASLLPVLGFVWFSLRRSISVPLADVASRLRIIASGEGDLTQRLPVRGQNEVSDVADAFNAFMTRLQAIVREVQAGTDSVLDTSQELSVLTDQVAGNSVRQCQDAYTMAAQVEVMTYTLDGLAEEAQSVRDTSSTSGRHSETGGAIIHNAVAEMTEIIATVDHSSQLIRSLGQRSDEITDIIRVIEEIADQTNLLALNAAIEAARAGDQGRGFSVVADEVRKLAERTSGSTQEIAAMIAQMQQGAHQAMKSMNASVHRVNEGTALAVRAGEAITQIKQGVQSVIAAVGTMAASLKDQAESNSQNAHKVESIARLAEDNSNTLQTTAQTAQRLDSLARHLQHAVGRFKT